MLGSLKSGLAKAFATLKKSTFLRNILVVMSGTAVAQAVGFALSPVISRLYSPTDFGLFGAFDAVLTVVAAGVTMDYAQAIMLPKKRGEAINTFLLACLSTGLITVLCAVVLIAVPGVSRSLLKTTGALVPSLLVVAILVNGLNTSFQAWCVRVKEFRSTSASQVIRSISANGLQVALGFAQGGPIALFVSSIAGNILASINLARVQIRDLWQLRKQVSWERMRQLGKEYKDFPIYSASQNVTNALSRGLPVLLLTQFFGIAAAGAYAFGMRIINVPMSFITSSLRQVLFQKASEAQHQGDRLLPLYLRTTAVLFSMAVLPALAILIWGPVLFSWVFGARWSEAGEYSRALIIWLAFGFCNLPAELFAKIIRIQRFVFIYDLALLAARALVLVLGGHYLSAGRTVLFFSLLGALMNTFMIIRVGVSVMKKDELLAPGHGGDAFIEEYR